MTRHRLTTWLAATALVFLATIACGPSNPGGAPPDDQQNEQTVEPRPVIYQLVVRYFGNVNGANKTDGSLATNGVGKFAHINDEALDSLDDLGITHVWLTGVLQQATATDWSNVGQPPDDPDILKGKAGSFYAVRDYFDVSPDYALDPARRMQEFEAAVERIHARDMKVLIDFVPNHVARTYHSDIKPDLDFGKDDDSSTFFDPENNFYYLTDPPGQSLQLPNPDHWTRPEGTDGTLEREDNDGMPAGDVPKVTGNNVATPRPSVSDWYETVKLNWGYNFPEGTTHYDPVPDTWTKMDRVLAYWQAMGVDGFRCDFAHLVPVEAWRWLIERAEERAAEQGRQVFFLAEAYNSSRAPPGFSLSTLVQVGFDAVYDDATFDTVKEIYCCGKWGNDLDDTQPDDFMFDRYLRYGENHDERRVASPVTHGDAHQSGFGSPQAGKAAVGTLFLLGSGPLLVFNGQTVGEPGAGREGFGGEDGRTTIFDYWTMPRHAKWVNGHDYDGGQLPQSAKDLRKWYKQLIELAQKPGFASGNIYGLQGANKEKSDGYTGGQWLYSFLRYDATRDKTWLVVANFSDQHREFELRVPQEALQFAGLSEADTITMNRVLDDDPNARSADPDALASGIDEFQIDAHDLRVYRLSEVAK